MNRLKISAALAGAVTAAIVGAAGAATALPFYLRGSSY